LLSKLYSVSISRFFHSFIHSF